MSNHHYVYRSLVCRQIDWGYGKKIRINCKNYIKVRDNCDRVLFRRWLILLFLEMIWLFHIIKRSFPNTISNDRFPPPLWNLFAIYTSRAPHNKDRSMWSDQLCVLVSIRIGLRFVHALKWGNGLSLDILCQRGIPSQGWTWYKNEFFFYNPKTWSLF